MSTEVELKLGLSPEAARRLARAAPLRGTAHGRPHRSHLETVYFDTPELALRAHGVALRVRRAGRHWVQAVKGGGHAQGGLHTRREWETRVAGSEPELQLLPPPARELLAPVDDIGRRLVPVFTTAFRRTTWQVAREGALIEVALDVGEIRAGRRRRPLCEVELELKEGRPLALFDLALTLLEAVPMVPEPRSKAERGYALFAATPAQPEHAEPVRLDAAGTAGLAFQRIASASLLKMAANHHGAVTGKDAEFLHQFRVALRRLRAALSLFDSLVGGAELDALKADLRDLARALNAARDWDVWVEETLPRMAQDGHARAAATLLRRSRAHQATHRQTARTALTHPNYARLMLRLERWLTALPESGLKPAQRRLWRTPVRAFAHESLARLDLAVRTRGRRLHQLTVVQRHQLRIAVKKLRYGMEFFAALFPQQETADYLKQLARLQDELGLFNDLAVAQSLLVQLRGVRPAPALAIAERWLQSQHATHQRRLKKRWKRFEHSTPFWLA